MKINILLLVLLYSLSIFAQTETNDPIDTKNDRLSRIQKSLSKLSEQIKKKKKAVNKEDSSLKIKLHLELEQLNNEYDSLHSVFIQLATGVDLNQTHKAEESKKVSLTDDIQEILTPVIQAFKEVSQKPRVIERLKQEKEDISKIIHQINLALTKLDELKKSKNSFKELYNSSKLRLKNEHEKYKLKLERINIDLHNLNKDNRTVFGEVSSVVKKFFNTKGKNILFSFIVFCSIFFPLRYWRERFINSLMRIIILRKGENYLWFSRTLDVFYITFTLIFSFLMGIGTLYILNDWILVTITFLLLGGIVWSLKAHAPHFFNQANLLLNLGTVRQDERVEFKGLFWKVKKLGFYTQLHNPLLEGGLLRVHSRQLVDLSSRPIVKMESWFPTRKGDWVIFDSLYGEVIQQTPDNVKVHIFGGSVKTIKATDFIQLSPINLSQNGFLISIPLGFDYGIQSRIISEIIPKLQIRMEENFKAQLDEEKIKTIIIKFDKANSSSLDVAANFYCSGDLASKKIGLEREIQKVFVEFCNEYNLSIPFNQLQVHMSK